MSKTNKEVVDFLCQREAHYRKQMLFLVQRINENSAKYLKDILRVDRTPSDSELLGIESTIKELREYQQYISWCFEFGEYLNGQGRGNEANKESFLKWINEEFVEFTVSAREYVKEELIVFLDAIEDDKE